MSEYIEREKAQDGLDNIDWYHVNDKGQLLPGGKSVIETYVPFKAVEEMLKSIPAADVRPVEWIPVTERLPETGVDVLVKFHQNMAVAFIDIGEWVVNIGDGWCTDINLAGGEKNPTHWMPLPQPPKED